MMSFQNRTILCMFAKLLKSHRSVLGDDLGRALGRSSRPITVVKRHACGERRCCTSVKDARKMCRIRKVGVDNAVVVTLQLQNLRLRHSFMIVSSNSAAIIYIIMVKPVIETQVEIVAHREV